MRVFIVFVFALVGCETTDTAEHRRARKRGTDRVLILRRYWQLLVGHQTGKLVRTSGIVCAFCSNGAWRRNWCPGSVRVRESLTQLALHKADNSRGGLSDLDTLRRLMRPVGLCKIL